MPLVWKKDGSASELFFDNFRSGAEFNGKKSLKNDFSHTGGACISEKTITRKLRKERSDSWRTFLFEDNYRGIKNRIGFLYVS